MYDSSREHPNAIPDLSSRLKFRQPNSVKVRRRVGERLSDSGGEKQAGESLSNLAGARPLDGRRPVAADARDGPLDWRRPVAADVRDGRSNPDDALSRFRDAAAGDGDDIPNRPAAGGGGGGIGNRDFSQLNFFKEKLMKDKLAVARRNMALNQQDAINRQNALFESRSRRHGMLDGGEDKNPVLRRSPANRRLPRVGGDEEAKPNFLEMLNDAKKMPRDGNGEGGTIRAEDTWRSQRRRPVQSFGDDLAKKKEEREPPRRIPMLGEFDMEGYLGAQRMVDGDGGDKMKKFQFNQVASDATPPDRFLKDYRNPL